MKNTIMREFPPEINFYAVKYFGENTVVKGFPSDVSDNAFFRKVAEEIAFDDIHDADVIMIIRNGERVTYAGWLPGMVFRFKNYVGDIVWEQAFPEWDH